MIDDAILDAVRHIGDGDVDAIVTGLGRDVWAVNGLLSGLARDDEPLPAALPAALARFVVPELPAWADLHRIRRAQRFAQDNLIAITVSLFCASLPAGYAAAAGARILRMSGRLAGDIDRRINETACFVLDVLRPNGFDAGGHARVAVGKVRLVHAAVRAAVLARGSEHEVPINQEDLLGTLGLFSVVVLKAIVRLGVRIDRRDREDYIHLWRAVGAMMGIREALLPTDFAGMEGVVQRIKARHFAASDDGRELMKALLDGMERHLAVPGLRPLPAALVRYLLGEDTAEILGLARAVPDRELAGRLAKMLPSSVAPDVGQRLLDAITRYKLGGARPTFAMPTRF